jgi:hypothetical protein
MLLTIAAGSPACGALDGIFGSGESLVPELFSIGSCENFPFEYVEQEGVLFGFNRENLIEHSETDFDKRRYRGLMSAVTDPDTGLEQQRFYMPFHAKAAVLRVRNTIQGLEKKWLVRASAGVYEWHDEADGLEAFGADRVLLHSDSLFVMEDDNIHSFVITNETIVDRNYFLPALSEHTLVNVHLVEDRLWLIQRSDNDGSLDIRHYDAVNGNDEQIVTAAFNPVQQDTGRQFSRQEDILPLTDSYLTVGFLEPLLEGETVWILEQWEADPAGGIDTALHDLQWGHILAEYRDLLFRNGNPLLIGRQRNYREWYYAFIEEYAGTASYVDSARQDSDNWNWFIKYSVPQVCQPNLSDSLGFEENSGVAWYVSELDAASNRAIGIRYWKNFMEVIPLR